MAVLSGTCHSTLACPEPALETEAPGQALALGRCQHAHIMSCVALGVGERGTGDDAAAAATAPTPGPGLRLSHLLSF